MYVIKKTEKKLISVTAGVAVESNSGFDASKFPGIITYRQCPDSGHS